MSTDVEWAARIDAAVDRAPANFDQTSVLALGKRRLRRRRRTVLGTTLAVVGVAGAGWGLAVSNDRTPDNTTRDVVADSTPTFINGPTPPPSGEALLRYDLNTGELAVRPGARIDRQVQDVVVGGLEAESVAAVISFEGQTWWTIASVTPRLSNWNDQHLSVDGRTFEQWVREKVTLATASRSAESGWVRLDETGKVVAESGVSVVEQTSPARPDQAPDGVLSATGTVEVNTALLCFVVRRSGDDFDALYLAESEYPGCGSAVPAIGDSIELGK